MNKTISNEKIIAALLGTESKRAAAKVLGIRPQTLAARMNDDAFQELYKESKKDLIKESITSIQAKTGRAIEVIFGIADNPEIAPQIRLNAAETILRYSYKFTESEEILTRIEELEEQYKEGG